MAKEKAPKTQPTEEPPPKEQPSYRTLYIARKLVEDGKITVKDMAGKLGDALGEKMPETSLAAMIAKGYQNTALTRIDALRQVVKDIRAGD